MMRIGSGLDFHRFEEGRPMIIGGIDFQLSYGLLGHSDADVLLHALMDAILGAIGRGDIGEHFSDRDPKFKDADSSDLLNEVLQMMRCDGYRVINMDATIIGEKPKISKYKEKIKKNVARLLKIEDSACNIKATTVEKMGALGREEGLGALVSVLLERGE